MDDTTRKLSDVLAGLVASMAHARAIADIEALRLAYGYRNNEFLQGMPIPRLRFQRVAVSLPVILTDVLPGKAAVPAHPAELVEGLRQAIATAIADARKMVSAQSKRASLTDDERRWWGSMKRLVNQFDAAMFVRDLKVLLEDAFFQIHTAATDAPTSPGETLIRTTAGNIVRENAKHVIRDLAYRYIQDRLKKENIGGQTGEEIEEEEAVEQFDSERARHWCETQVIGSGFVEDFLVRIATDAARRAIAVPGQSPDFAVSVNTDDIKNGGGGPDAITRLNLVMHEEGLEWIEESAAGGSVSRLKPE